MVNTETEKSMSDTPPIFTHIDRYLELGRTILSPALYLGTGLQPYWMKSAEYTPITDDAPALTAENMEALVESCASPEQRATLDEQSAVDFIFPVPAANTMLTCTNRRPDRSWWWSRSR